MNINNLLGYSTDRAYSKNSSTNVGQFALIKIVSQVKGLFLGSLSIPLAKLKIGSATPTSVYLGSNKIL